MEFYNYDLNKFYDAYKEFIKKAQIRVINAEDEFLGSLDIDAIKLYPSKDITQIKSIVKNGEPFTSFILKDLGRFEVWGIGEHIAIDASLAILAAITQDNLEIVRQKIKNYRGIKKRFDIVAKDEGFVLIDDYGHHPTEISATLKSAKTYAKLMGFEKITAIWQPHKYRRTIDNLEGFKECFKEVDDLVILPVWRVAEEEIEIDFENHFKRYSPIFADRIKRDGNRVKLLDNSAFKEIDRGLVIGFGAGNITYQLRGIE
jgi:UDP-N-acetylmuramate--alanine ligase